MPDPLILKAQLDSVISEHNESYYQPHIKFKAGFGVVNLSNDDAYSKFIIPNNTANQYDHPTYNITYESGGVLQKNSSNVLFASLELPALMQAFTTSAGIAKAFRFAVGYRPASGYNAVITDRVPIVANPQTGGYNVKNGFVIRDNSTLPNASMDVGQHCFAPGPGMVANTFKACSIYARAPQFSSVVVRNTVTGGAYATAAPFYVQLRVGTSAAGAGGNAADGCFATAAVADNYFAVVSLRLIGFYV
jgi:hypothetical protein